MRTATPNQTPGKWTFGVQGELVIARRARPATQAAPLPPELQDAIDSRLASVRAAAVEELERVLHGKHAGRALAARQALRELTDDDSRMVAAAAAAALADTAEAGPAAAATAEPEPVALASAKPEPVTPATAEPEPVAPASAEPEPVAAAITEPVPASLPVTEPSPQP